MSCYTVHLHHHSCDGDKEENRFHDFFLSFFLSFVSFSFNLLINLYVWVFSLDIDFPKRSSLAHSFLYAAGGIIISMGDEGGQGTVGRTVLFCRLLTAFLPWESAVAPHHHRSGEEGFTENLPP